MTLALKLTQWLTASIEHEHLEFKEAKNSFELEKLMRYCAALANEGGGYLVLGVADRLPRIVVGTNAFANLNEIKRKLLDTLHHRIEVSELFQEAKRVLIFDIPSRPTGRAIALDGAYFMRSGESLVPMSSDKLKRIFAEDQENWFDEVAISNLNDEETIDLLDIQTYFQLTGKPLPRERTEILERLANENLIVRQSFNWAITNMGALLFAKELAAISEKLAAKAPRLIVYKGSSKRSTQNEYSGKKGYAIGFESLIDYIHNSGSQNQFVEEGRRDEKKMFPRQAIRELFANALVHQDFSIAGNAIRIELFDDRIEISNPGAPTIETNRFIDDDRARNANLMRVLQRVGVCESKGSGIDKVIELAEEHLLPAPLFTSTKSRTTAVLFAKRDFFDMSKEEKIRACYQQAALLFANRQPSMSNQSLRERFQLSEKQSPLASAVIADAKTAGLIKSDTSESSSTRYARYLPYWA